MSPGTDSGSKLIRLMGLAAVLLAGCAGRPAQAPDWPWPDSPYSESTSGTGNGGDSHDGGRAESTGSALLARNEVNQSLVDAARSARQRGDIPAAVAHLERGISIAPQDPLLWFELARTRYEQGRYAQAENLAQRALEQADEAEMIVPMCWLLIADAREAMGDSDGARQARDQARFRS